MNKATFYGAGFPYRDFGKLPGKLIVLEGTDGVGRSTQVKKCAHGSRRKAMPFQTPV